MNNYPKKNFFGFPELLSQRTRLHSAKPALILLNERGEEVQKVNYRQLLNRIAYYSEELKKKVKKQQTCLLLISPGADFLTAFFSCLYTGVIAVPVNMPRRNKENRRFWAIFEDANISCILTDKRSQKWLDKYFREEERISNLPKIVIGDKESDKLPEISAGPDDTAYLQYTSGSTGKPRGVMITQQNLVSNSEIIKQSFQHDENLVGVNWLPHFHDMGLVGTLLQPLYVGGSSIIMQPADFLKNPYIWFKSIQKYGAQTIGCPNFALDYAVAKISDEQVKELDLSSVKVLFCGAEPVRKQSLLRFEEKFKEAGFKRKMFLPCYGLAESTLMVSGISANEEPSFIKISKKEMEVNNKISSTVGDETDMLEPVSCGHGWLDTRIFITDPAEGTTLPEGSVGEIRVSGSSVGKGYWKNEEETLQTFKATIKGLKGSYLRTGDIGFIYQNHLYITGRSKDLIIIRGVNHYPHLIETTVENSHEALQENACAAFSSDHNNQEQLILAAEIKRTFIKELPAREIIESIRNAVTKEHAIMPYAIVLISTGSIPRTSSGKIIRGECRKLWQEQQFNSFHIWEQAKEELYGGTQPSDSLDDISQWLSHWISNKTGTEPGAIDLNKPITAYGLDSIAAVELERDLYNRFSIRIFLSDFLENKALKEILINNKNEDKTV